MVAEVHAPWHDRTLCQILGWWRRRHSFKKDPSTPRLISERLLWNDCVRALAYSANWYNDQEARKAVAVVQVGRRLPVASLAHLRPTCQE